MTETDALSRRRFLEGTGAAAVAAATAGCTGGNDSNTSDDTETNSGDSSAQSTEKRYRGVMVGTATTFDPVAATDTASGTYITNVFDGLVTYPNGQTNAETKLAADYETSENGRVLTFQLKEGVTYNDGQEVTASDVVYTFERVAASPNSLNSQSILGTLGVEHETETDEEGNEQYVPGSLGVEATGEYEVTIRLQEPFYAAFVLLAQTPYFLTPEGIVGDVEGYEGELSYDEFSTSNPVGAGPYELAEWSEATTVSLDARDDYHDGEPANGGLDYSVFTEANAAYTYATSNVNADRPYIPSSRYDPELRNFEGTDDRGRQYGTYGPFDPNGMTADYYEVPTLSTYYNAFNCATVPKPVRRAVAYAMSQQTINEDIIATPGEPAAFFTPPALFPGGRDRYEELRAEYPYGYDEARLDDARQVMEDAGYGPNDRYELNFDMYSSLASSFGEDMYSLLRDKLQQAHINLELRTADWSTYLQRGRKGNFELYTSGWIAGYPGADKFTALLDPRNTITPDGEAYMNWTAENGDAAGRAKDAWDRVENNFRPSEEAAEIRADAYVELERANWEDAVLVPWQHGIDQRYSYEWLDENRFGAMGPSRKKSDDISIGDRGEYE